MKIKSTDSSYCTVKSTKVSGNTAYITLLIMSNTPQSKHCAFSFWIKDLDNNEYTRANNNKYWIDRCNNYNNYSGNIDINMYKEITLTVDITKANTSPMQLNRWFRPIQITIKSENAIQTSEDLWESETLELLSDEIILPNITNLICRSESEYGLKVLFNLKYKSQEDFNYINNNLLFLIRTRSVYDNHIIESQNFLVNNQDTNFEINFEGVSFINSEDGEYMCINGKFVQYTSGNVTRYKKITEGYDNPVYIDILILNLKEETLYEKTIFFRPYTIANKFTYKGLNNPKCKRICVKTSEGVSNIKQLAIK